MTVDFYKFLGKNNELEKTITKTHTIELQIKDNFNDIDSIELLLTDTELLSQSNYCYIPKFKRYYFITSRKIIVDKLVKINCDCDLLMTFKNEILETVATSVESETNYNSDYAETQKSKVFKTKTIDIATDFINVDNKMVLVTEK